ncbi:MAG: signal peptidase I [Lachnospiraceae bacterium]|nr:signal peptidase I [Lachnospiraceae bacterium]
MKGYEKRIKEKNYLVIAVKILTDITVVAGVAIFLFAHFFDEVKVSGTSMEPSFEDGDILYLDEFTYKFFDAKRLDVIAFTLDNSDTVYVKRIIGLPGEKVQIKNGSIYIDGKLLEADIEAENILNAGDAEEVIKLGDDEYFVLGDNRNNSEDSRFASIGMVKEDNIIGRAWLEVTSLKDFGFVKAEEQEVAE